MNNIRKKANTPWKKKGVLAFMASKKQKPIVLSELTKEEVMKYEIAEELGLLDRVMTDGWKSLSSKETGRIGGILAKKKRERTE